MKILRNFPLTRLNAFRVPVKAKYFIRVNNEKDLKEISKYTQKQKLFVLGDGTNTLFTKNFDGTILKIAIKGMNPVKNLKNYVVLDVAAGENWHKLVMYSVNKGWSGIENLSYIPGTVGAAPVQNIAAYGQNFGDSAVSVTGYNLETGKKEIIPASECRFYYRDSIFKHKLKNKFLITSVRIKLYKTPHFDTNYFGSKPYESLVTEIQKIVPSFPNAKITPKIVAQAVINQRRIKMPNWRKVGTAGSFFKNPFVSKSKFEMLKKRIPDIQAYPVDKMLYPHPDDPVLKMKDKVKIPAGKLLEVLGWRGKIKGKVGTFERHALIVVSQKGATSRDILGFTSQMQRDVFNNYKIGLEPEVNIV